MSNRESIRRDLRKIDDEYKQMNIIFLIYLRNFLYTIFIFLIGFNIGTLY